MLFDDRCGHSPSTSPTRNTSSNSPYRAACASSSCTPLCPARGANVCPSIHRRIIAATSTSVTGESSRCCVRPPQALNRRQNRAARAEMPLSQRIADRGHADRARRETPAARRAAPTAVRVSAQRAQLLGGGGRRLRGAPSIPLANACRCSKPPKYPSSLQARFNAATSERRIGCAVDRRTESAASRAAPRPARA